MYGKDAWISSFEVPLNCWSWELSDELAKLERVIVVIGRVEGGVVKIDLVSDEKAHEEPPRYQKQFQDIMHRYAGW